MCCCLLTTSFGSHKPAQRCRHYLGERQVPWVISQHLPLRWATFRRESPLPPKDRSLHSRRCMFPRTISPTLRRQTLLRTWTQPSCLSGRLLSSEFIPLLTHWHPRRRHWPPRLLAKTITTSLEMCS